MYRWGDGRWGQGRGIEVGRGGGVQVGRGIEVGRGGEGVYRWGGGGVYRQGVVGRGKRVYRWVCTGGGGGVQVGREEGVRGWGGRRGVWIQWNWNSGMVEWIFLLIHLFALDYYSMV